MATGFGISEILAGAPAEAESTITILDAASPPDSSALRTLTHPDTVNFPIVTYNRNPDRTINFDTVPLNVPNPAIVRTLGTTLAKVTPNAIDDVIVTEIWTSSGGFASMLTAQFRRFFELLINPPAIVDPQTFIQWAPADRTTDVFNVELLDLRVGGAHGKLDVKDWAVDQIVGLEAVATGVMDKQVQMDLLIVSKV